MYSVSRRPVTVEETACVGTHASSADCQKSAGGPSKLLRANETIVRDRTDSAAMALMEKKQKASRPTERPDLGFIR